MRSDLRPEGQVPHNGALRVRHLAGIPLRLEHHWFADSKKDVELMLMGGEQRIPSFRHGSQGPMEALGRPPCESWQSSSGSTRE